MLKGHFSFGPLTVYGRNAMHWGITFYTKSFGYICFRLPFTCFKRWWPLYFYVSPNATPQASTFYLGEEKNEKRLSRIRRIVLGHNYNVEDESIKNVMRLINDSKYGTMI